MHIVVINKNQQEYVKPMIDALYPNDPLFVFDRCTPVDGCRFISNSMGEGFLAGRMRDLGAKDIDDDILFLDGDKIPNRDILMDIEFLRAKYDCICYGVDKEFESSEMRSFMREDSVDDIVPWQKNSWYYATGCYSCGMWLSKEAVSAVRRLNGGRIFHPAFDGNWGDEDNFLADELNYLGFTIGYSTHVRLSGMLSDWTTKSESLAMNFLKRIELRKSLLGMEF